MLTSVDQPEAGDFDAIVVHTVHPGLVHTWMAKAPIVLDTSYRLDALPDRAVV